MYPYHFSGGMRQRSVLAIALAGNPSVLIADEPTTALDVTIQAQILDLFREIQKKRNTATIFVTHDLGVVARVADRVAVMYAGKIVEIGTAEEIFYGGGGGRRPPQGDKLAGSRKWRVCGGWRGEWAAGRTVRKDGSSGRSPQRRRTAAGPAVGRGWRRGWPAGPPGEAGRRRPSAAGPIRRMGCPAGRILRWAGGGKGAGCGLGKHHCLRWGRGCGIIRR